GVYVADERREPLGFGVDPRRLVEARQAGRRVGRHELRRRLQLGADDANLDAVDREDLGRVEVVRAPSGRRLDDVRREEWEMRPRDVVLQTWDPEVELVVAQ